jgi:hypothetical protein
VTGRSSTGGDGIGGGEEGINIGEGGGELKGDDDLRRSAISILSSPLQ